MDRRFVVGWHVDDVVDVALALKMRQFVLIFVVEDEDMTCKN